MYLPPPSLAQRLLMAIDPETVTRIMNEGNFRSLHAKWVLMQLLRCTQGTVNKIDIAGRKFRSLLLEFTADIREGRAVIPGIRLAWINRQGSLDVRARFGVLMLTGEQADSIKAAEHLELPGAPCDATTRKPIDELIRKAGFTIESAAAKSGISEETLENILRGIAKPRAQTIHQLAMALGVTFDEVRSAFLRRRYNLRRRKQNPVNTMLSEFNTMMSKPALTLPTSNAIPADFHVEFDIKHGAVINLKVKEI